MKFSSKIVCCISLLFFVFVLTGSAFCETPSGALLPAGMVIKEAFVPGIGAAVGEISQASGKVAVIHADDTQGYWVKQGYKLFKGDTLVTLADAFLSFTLSDGSFMTLSPETKLVITKSIYAPEKQTRSTFIDLLAGKTRFIVKKLVEARHSEFKVKTTTSVAGVRGSDFIIYTMESATEITTLQNTELEVVSLAAPDVKPTILHDYEKTSIRKGKVPEEARKVSADEVDRLMKEFKFKPSAPTTGAGQEQIQAGVGTEAPVSEAAYPAMMLREDDLVKPDFQIPQTGAGGASLDDRFQARRLFREEQNVENTKADITQQQSENVIKSKLPDFPGTP